MSTIHETPSGRIIATGYALTDLECQNEGVHKAPTAVGIELSKDELIRLFGDWFERVMAEAIIRGSKP